MRTEESFHLSRWCHGFTHADTMALFHAVNLCLMFLPKAAGEKVLRLAGQLVPRATWEDLLEPETVQFMVDEGLLLANPSQDDVLLSDTRGKLKSGVTLELLYLLVTDNCNLRCRYCFEEAPGTGDGFKPTQMTRETARRALEIFARLQAKYGDSGKTKIIHLYGGEPLLNPDVVEFAVLEAGRLKASGDLPDSTEITIVTNGTLMTEEQAKFMAQHGVTVGLSLDGPKPLNNLYRIGKKSGLDVGQAVLETYDLLIRHKARVGLSVTLTPESVSRCDELLEFFASRTPQAEGFSLNLLHNTPGMDPEADYYRLGVRCQLRAFEAFRQKGIYEERLMRKAKAFVNRKPMYADCGVVGNQLVVAPDGRVGVCQDFVKPRTYFSGSVRDPDFDPVVSGLFADWSDRSPFNMAQCQACPALGMCGGGCPASAEVKYGDRWHVDERICHHSRTVLEWLIWETYSQL